MENHFLTNYTDQVFLDRIKENLRKCKAFYFSVSFIKKAGLVLLFKDIEAAIERGCFGRVITSTYQNFTDIESLKSFFSLMAKHENFECHLDFESFSNEQYSTLGFHIFLSSTTDMRSLLAHRTSPGTLFCKILNGTLQLATPSQQIPLLRPRANFKLFGKQLIPSVVKFSTSTRINCITPLNAGIWTMTLKIGR